jgi:hypothetical protein
VKSTFCFPPKGQKMSNGLRAVVHKFYMYCMTMLDKTLLRAKL